MMDGPTATSDAQPARPIPIPVLWGGCCVVCGLTEAEIEALGLLKTVQHSPPFVQNGHDTNFLPFCSWCQQIATSQMKRLKSFIDRIAELRERASRSSEAI